MKRSGLGFLPFIIIIPLFLFGGVFRILFSVIAILLVIAIIVYFARIIISAITDRKQGNDSSSFDFHETNDIDEPLKSYFNNNGLFPLTENIYLKTNAYKSVTELDVYYRNNYVSKLSELLEVNGETYDKVYDKLNDYVTNKNIRNISYEFNDTFNTSQINISSNFDNAGMLNKPEVMDINKDYNNVFDAYRDILENVSYGEANNKDYVDNHIKAINKYYEFASNHVNDLEVVEQALGNEIENAPSANVEQKGYYDGLFYCLKALRKAKTYMLEKCSKELNNDLR
ncbi:MAG: hypothetical protein Q4E33_01620 [Erysipelotrichaceae bacterium]|nr:hypothetical protein [Erysipelotrichaceae bacterium]